MKKFIFALLLLASCKTPEEQEQARIERDIYVLSSNFKYYKDTTTGLCFAGFSVGWQSGVLSNVPCSEQVEKVAHRFSSGR